MSRKFLLDTDTVSFAMRGEGGVGRRLLDHRPSEVCISSITLGELRFGAELRRSRKLHGLIDRFVSAVDVEPFDAAAADRFGALAAALRDAGAPIGQMDTLIASHALALGLTLVTGNERHFAEVAGLRVENWV
ncbi:MAG: PIN domain-containing protein [Elusimicrobia bacterium]|nr:PIN domain-containing protein [Elusimicrobiota bacterium]